MKLIEQQLRETIGLDAASVGTAAIHRAIRLQMQRLGLQTASAYAQLLANSPADWSELVEAVVVTETWFFREPEAFAALVRFVQEEWLPGHPARELRLLSVPCASGEEPYSAVMALVDAGVPPARFRIEAADISARALARAREGVYGKNSFRGQDLGFRQRHFYPAQEGFALAPAIRDCVHFEQGNPLDEAFAPGHGSYDVIFCRNLLIYFDRPTQARALARLAGLLSAEGLLFVGPAEQPLALAHGFVSANVSPGFACRKRHAAAAAAEGRRQPAWSAEPPLASLPAGSSRSQWPFRPPPLPEERRASALHGPTNPTAPSWRIALHDASTSGGVSTELELARRLADAGRLSEAAALCETHLSHSTPSAQAYYLLGLVREAGGDARADDCYRKALYLEPNHYESLLQLAYLTEKNGDPARARLFRRRAQRLRPGE